VEERPQSIVIRRLEEFQFPRVPHINVKSFGYSGAKIVNCRAAFLLPDFFISLFERVGVQSLPGQGALKQINEHVPEGFEIVATTLLPAQVGVDAHVADGAG